MPHVYRRSDCMYNAVYFVPLVKFKKLLYFFQKNTYKVRLQNVKYSKYIAISCRTGRVYTTVGL